MPPDHRGRPSEESPVHPGPAQPPVLLVTMLFVVALAGRFAPPQAVFVKYGISDLRVPGCLLLGAGTLLWYAVRRRERRPRPGPRSVLLCCALIGLQLLSAMWSPPGARVGKVLWDLTALLILILVTAVLSTTDPDRMARILLVLMLAAGVLYTVAALRAAPPGAVRITAFGGGPNIFVRVISLAMVAAVTLAVAWRRWWLLTPLPALWPTAVLSGSRGGLVACVVAAAGFLLLFARRWRIASVIRVALTGAIIAAAGWALLGSDVARTMDNRYTTVGVQANGFSGRPELLAEAWSIFVAHPLTGAGIDSYQAIVGVAYPHNYLAGLAAETGAPALVLLVLLVVRWWRDGSPWQVASPAQIGCAVGAIYIGAASMFSGDYYDTRFMWILAIVAMQRGGGHQLAPAPRRARPAVPIPGTPRSRLANLMTTDISIYKKRNHLSR